MWSFVYLPQNSGKCAEDITQFRTMQVNDALINNMKYRTMQTTKIITQGHVERSELYKQPSTSTEKSTPITHRSNSSQPKLRLDTDTAYSFYTFLESLLYNQFVKKIT